MNHEMYRGPNSVGHPAGAVRGYPPGSQNARSMVSTYRRRSIIILGTLMLGTGAVGYCGYRHIRGAIRPRTLFSSLHDTTRVMSLAWSQDGRTLVTAHKDSKIRFFDVGTGKISNVMTDPERETESVAWSSDGGSLAIADVGFGVRILDTDSRTLLRTLEKSYPKQSYSPIVWSPDGRFLVTIGDGGEVQLIRIWDTTGWTISRNITRSHSKIDSVAWSPDGRFLAIAQWGMRVTILDTRSWTVVRTLAEGTIGVNDVAWSPDGRTLATACKDSKVRIWDTVSWKIRQTLTDFIHGNASGSRGVPAESHDAVEMVRWSADGELLATVHHSLVQFWDPATWQKLTAIREVSTDVLIAWAPSGRDLAVVSNGLSPSVRIWGMYLDR
jgi:WD40 repeat protein